MADSASNALHSLIRDFRYGIRTLARTPGFSIIAILVMALGIGSAVALFTVVHSVLLKPLPLPDADRLVMLYEADTTFRQVYLDGRKLPADPQPSWMGYSVGHWEGDWLVIDAVGFNERAWLDAFGHTHSDQLKVTERFHRRDFGHMDVQITIDDPKTYTKPFTVMLTQRLLPDTDLIESYCTENEQDVKHMINK